MAHVKVTFGIIVLNGEPFTKFNLRALYPFAHEIIVVEGAAYAARKVATPDGHSLDGTCEAVRDFMREEDPDGKVQLVTAEDEGHPNGFWPGEKDEQSQAYAKRASGNYLWQIDVDEFYFPEDMDRILRRLADDPDISAVSFHQKAFWGDVDIEVDSHYLQASGSTFHRLFKWGPGYRYDTHRPPTVLDEAGRDLRSIRWMSDKDTAAMGVYLMHYSLLFPKQVREKCAYYSSVDWTERSEASHWAERNYMRISSPWRVYNVYSHMSWLEPYSGPVPEQVRYMMEAVRDGRIDVEMRDNRDARALLANPFFRFKRFFVKRFGLKVRRKRRWLLFKMGRLKD